MGEKRYKTRRLKCWPKAKELRQKYYEEYAEIKDKGGLRAVGGAWTFHPIAKGLGDDVCWLTSEPYGASCAFQKSFSDKCLEETEKHGYARDLCAYMRNYWGSMFLNQYAFGGEFPRPDFTFQNHICCSHSKWYQTVGEYEGTPEYSVDMSTGPYYETPYSKMEDYKIDYVAGQLLDGIEWLEKVTGRKYDDEKLIEAVHINCRMTALWSEICALNMAIPAPLDEKTMYSLYVFPTLDSSKKEFLDLYEELRDETKERVADGIAAVAAERFRVISDSQPPWGFLSLWRRLEKYGVVSVGALYTFALMGTWEKGEDGTWVPARTPQQKGIEIKNREDACRVLADWYLRKLVYSEFYHPDVKSHMMIDIVKQWKANAVIIHLNRGCEGTAIGQSENRLALLKEGIPVLTYEGNMGDEREFDEGRSLARVEAFMESLDLKQID